VRNLQKPFAILLLEAKSPKEADQIVQQNQSNGEYDERNMQVIKHAVSYLQL